MTLETRVERPAHATRITTEPNVDDLPPGPPPREPDRQAALRYQLRWLEAQATSLGRELVATRASERALHLVTATIRAVRAALYVLG